MRYLTIVLLFVIPLVHGRSLVPSNMGETIDENQMDTEKQRSIRVHRVSDESPLTSSIKNAKSQLPMNVGNEETDQHKSWSHLNELKEFVVSQENKADKFKTGESSDRHEEHEALLLKPLKFIAKELSREKTTKLKNFDAKDNEDGKPVPKPINNSLKDLLDSPKEFNIYYQDSQEKEKHIKSSVQLMNDDETKIVRTGGEYLDDVLAGIQNQIGTVRNYFDKLCRKHHSLPSTPSREDAPREDFAINQPKKISIL